MASAAAVAGISRLGVEESTRAWGWCSPGRSLGRGCGLAWVGVVAVFAVGTLLLCGLGSGLAQWLSGVPRDAVERNMRAAVAYVPGVLIVTGVAALLVALSPRLRGLAWLPVGWALVVGLLGEALRLPRWSRDRPRSSSSDAYPSSRWTSRPGPGSRWRSGVCATSLAASAPVRWHAADELGVVPCGGADELLDVR
jgi:hypothetical protein